MNDRNYLTESENLLNNGFSNSESLFIFKIDKFEGVGWPHCLLFAWVTTIRD